MLFRLGVCRYKLSSISTAVALFDEALALAERSGLPCDLLRADILGWRSRCHRRQRDYVAAREDVERALELAQDVGDRRAIANTYFQASLIAQRQGHWVLSRNYAQRAKELYQELNDERNVGRLLLMLGGLTLLLGDEEQAVEHLKASYSRALDSDSPADAAQALDGLARVHLNRGEYDQADELARKALELLEGTGGLPPRSLPVAARTGTSASRARTARRGGETASGRLTPRASSSRRSATGRRRGLRWVTSRLVEETTARRHVSTGTPLRRSRKSASKRGGRQ